MQSDRSAPRANGAVRLRRARTTDHHSVINGIVNTAKNRLSFGWVARVVLDAAANDQAAHRLSQHLYLVAEQAGEIVGFTRAYHRRDGVTTLHELGVAEHRQSQGIGARLLKEVVAQATARGQTLLLLKTPVEMASNKYYPRFGFARIAQETGRKRPLNVYVKALRARRKAA